MRATYIEGDAFHRYDRQGMKRAIADAATQGNSHFSHVSVDGNLLDELAHVFAEFPRKGTGRTRHYVHDEIEAELSGRPAGTFTDWEELDPTVELLFYVGLHGAADTRSAQLSDYGDLKAGLVEEVAPVQAPAPAALDELQLPPEQRMKRMRHRGLSGAAGDRATQEAHTGRGTRPRGARPATAVPVR